MGKTTQPSSVLTDMAQQWRDRVVHNTLGYHCIAPSRPYDSDWAPVCSMHFRSSLLLLHIAYRLLFWGNRCLWLSMDAYNAPDLGWAGSRDVSAWGRWNNINAFVQALPLSRCGWWVRCELILTSSRLPDQGQIVWALVQFAQVIEFIWVVNQATHLYN